MCGVFGIFDHPEAANLTYLGLHALQHRGQESGGVVSNDGGILHAVRKMGYVADIFDKDVLAQLRGRLAIGHVRYSTSGGSLPKNVQPLCVEIGDRSLSVAHNGNLVNSEVLREELEQSGSIFFTNSDTEVIVHLMAKSAESSIVGRLSEALNRVRGAYSLVITAGDSIFAARDPNGFRPLILGKVRGSSPAWVVASETCAFDLIDAERVRDIEPGEILEISDSGLTSHTFAKSNPRRCVFEKVYFARPDSVLDGEDVYASRILMGEALAKEHPADADVVIPVPDSGVVAAMGFAKASGIEFGMGLIRNHYVGRTFIEPKDSIRHFGVRLKLNAVPHVLRGKRVVVVDDSIVRGTTSRKIVKMIRDAGAKEVHVRISSPPVIGPCYYGIDTPTREELVASTHNSEQVARYILADSLGYLSPAGLLAAVNDAAGENHCTACFTGDYPVQIVAPPKRRQLRLIEV
jgi:amidophosphoribosyltransferase